MQRAGAANGFEIHYAYLALLGYHLAMNPALCAVHKQHQISQVAKRFRAARQVIKRRGRHADDTQGTAY
jgi:hypothetical protein